MGNEATVFSRVRASRSITATLLTSGIQLRTRTCLDPQYPHPTTPTLRPGDFFALAAAEIKFIGGACRLPFLRLLGPLRCMTSTDVTFC